MGVSDADGAALPLGQGHQPLDLAADLPLLGYMIEKNVPLGEGHLQQTGRWSAQTLGGGATVDEKKVAFFEDRKNLVHLGGAFRHPGAHVIVDPLDAGYGRQVFLQLTDQFIGGHRNQQGAPARLDRGVFLGFHGKVQHGLHPSGAHFRGKNALERAERQDRKRDGGV